MTNNGGLSLTLQQLTELLGTVSIVPMGNWNSTTLYQKLNIVNSNGGSYIAKKSSQNFQPEVTSGWQDVWMPIGAEGQQGASVFHTMAASGTSIAVSGLQPQLPPFVGDAVLFPNGDVRQITAVSGSIVTLGDVLFSLKGDGGIGNATLSNIDGDSTENGFTQAAVKGIAQAKNYYNLGEYDTYISNGEGTGTVARKTQYNDDGTQTLLPSQYQYTEKVIENQPIRIANQEQEWYWDSEWRKGLNLYKGSQSLNYQNFTTLFEADELPIGTYTILISATTDDGNVNQIVGGGFKQADQLYVMVNKPVTFTTTDTSKIQIYTNTPTDVITSVMIVKGTIPYPYEDYYGKLIHEIDLSGIQLFPEAVNPAETIGGDWVDLGTTTVGTTTLHAYQKVSGGN